MAAVVGVATEEVLEPGGPFGQTPAMVELGHRQLVLVGVEDTFGKTAIHAPKRRWPSSVISSMSHPSDTNRTLRRVRRDTTGATDSTEASDTTDVTEPRADESDQTAQTLDDATPAEAVIAGLEAVLGSADEMNEGTSECPNGQAAVATWDGTLMVDFDAEQQFLSWALLPESDLTTTDDIGIGSPVSALDGVEFFADSTLGDEFNAGGFGGLADGTGDDATIDRLWAGEICSFRQRPGRTATDSVGRMQFDNALAFYGTLRPGKSNHWLVREIPPAPGSRG